MPAAVKRPAATTKAAAVKKAHAQPAPKAARRSKDAPQPAARAPRRRPAAETAAPAKPRASRKASDPAGKKASGGKAAPAKRASSASRPSKKASGTKPSTGRARAPKTAAVSVAPVQDAASQDAGESSVMIELIPQPADAKKKYVASIRFGKGFRLHRREDATLYYERIRNQSKHPRFDIHAWKALVAGVLEQCPVLPPRNAAEEPPLPRHVHAYHEAMRNYIRSFATVAGLAPRAARRRARIADPADGAEPGAEAGPQRKNGFRGYEKISNPFADFIQAIGGSWVRGEWHSRGRAASHLFGYVREQGLRDKQSKPKKLNICDNLRKLLPEGDDGSWLGTDASLQRLLSKHIGEKMLFPTDCAGEAPVGEDDSPVPARFAKKPPRQCEGVSHGQVARVSRIFAETVSQQLAEFPKEPTSTLHSRRVCLWQLEQYCRERKLVVYPSPNAPVLYDTAGRKRPASLAFKVDATIKALFTSIGEPEPADDAQLTRFALRCLTYRHVASEPDAPSDCPPWKECVPAYNDHTRLPVATQDAAADQDAGDYSDHDEEDTAANAAVAAKKKHQPEAAE